MSALLAKTELQPLLGQVMPAIIDMQGAQSGCIYLFDPASGALEPVAHDGFDPRCAEQFLQRQDDSTICARALLQRERIIIEDVRNDGVSDADRAGVEAAGYRAVQVTPLLDRIGAPLGVISTYFAAPHAPLERELRLTDLLARLVAELIGRQRTEGHLRESEERFRRYFDLGLIGMAITSPTKGCLEANDELCRILGYDREELLAKTWEQMTHPDDLVADVAQFDRVIAGEIDGYTLDKRWIRKDGRVIDSIMAAKCVRKPDGSVDYLVGMLLDTTERKRAEERLAESERRFRLLTESIPHHVWSFQPDGSVGYCNQRLLEYTGLSPLQIRRDGFWSSLHPMDVDAVKAAWANAIATGSDWEMEQRVRGRDGRYRRFVSRGVVVKDDQGQPLEWFGTNTDVEDRQLAEEQLAKTRFELQRVMRVNTMGELAASIAHEVNQPLTAICTNAYAGLRWLAAEVPNVSETTATLERILRDATRAEQVVTRIRTFLRRAPVRRVPVDLAEVIANVTDIAQGAIKSEHVGLEFSPAKGLPLINGDRVQLQQVVLNLVLNAIEAMRGVSGRPRVLRIDTAHDANGLTVSVCDSGPGLVVEQRQWIFEPFHTTKPDGMGMGLAISRSIVEAHGGRLWATANTGPGETFHFTVPLCATSAS